jgi:hypothetical protein
MVKGDDLTISMTALHACFEPICEKGLEPIPSHTIASHPLCTALIKDES